MSVLYWPGGIRSAVAGSISRPPKRRSNIVSPRAWASGVIVPHRPSTHVARMTAAAGPARDRTIRPGAGRSNDARAARGPGRSSRLPPRGPPNRRRRRDAGSARPTRTRKVVVVMPAYNAAKTLERTYADIPHDIVDRIILVDDVSKDETVDIARQLGLDVIIHQQNLGYGGNQKTCYEAALEQGADVVVMLHPDYQYDATRIPDLIAPILGGEKHLMLGSRFLGDPLAGGMPKWKYVANRFLTTVENVVVRAPPVRVPHRAPGLQPATPRDDPVRAQQQRLRVRPGADRPGRRGRDGPPDRRDRRPDALLRRGELGRVQAERRVRPVHAAGRRSATCSTGSASAAAPKLTARASEPPPAGRLSRARRRPDAAADPPRAPLSAAAISLVALVLVLRGVDLQETADILRSADSRWIAVAFVVRDRSTSAIRGAALAAPRPPDPGRPLPATCSATCSSATSMNNILPARLGELVRSHYLGDREGISRTSALGTVVVERVVDLVVCRRDRVRRRCSS